MSKPLVALVGRPNVGKSTLFNRLTGQRIAIVDDTPGVTRDRIYAPCSWRGRQFSLVDTGGLGSNDKVLPRQEQGLAGLVEEQSQIGIQEADLILLVLDGKEGIIPLDSAILRQLYKSSKPVIVIVNKVDNPRKETLLAEFYALGKQIFPISAKHGLGIGELLDEVIERLPISSPEPAEEEDRLKIALIGRPNVGKSSLLNCFIGAQRALVCGKPGTTRDAVDTPFNIAGRPATLIDTAGIRRKGKTKQVLEKYCVIKALQSIERADVCLLIIDAVEGVAEQDTKLAGYVHNAGKACVVVVNKWDLIEEEVSPKQTKAYLAAVKERLAFLRYAPLVSTSALQGKGVKRVLNKSLQVWQQANQKIATPQLNQFIQAVTDKHPPPSHKGKPTKIYYLTQSGVCPPTFSLFVNNPEGFHFSYLRYLNNQLRRAFGFHGTPLRLIPLRRR